MISQTIEVPKKVKKNRSSGTVSWVLGESNWKPNHTKVLKMTFEERSLDEIAKAVGMTKNTVVSLRKQKFFRIKLQDMQSRVLEKATDNQAHQLVISEARDILVKAAPEAANKMKELSKTGTKDQKVQFDAAKDILDRAGLKPVEVIEARERVYSVEEIQAANKTLKETETIITRLQTKSSRFILRDSRGVSVESSVTDKGSDDATEAETTDA